MKSGVRSVILSLTVVLLAVAGVYAVGNSPPEGPSLGEIAREIKAQKAKEPKPAKVFTNDNLEISSSWVTSGDKEGTVATPPAEGLSASPTSHNAEYYRSQMSTLKSHLETDQRELNVLQQKLGQNQMQYYSDPNKSLQQQYSREDVNKLTDEIDAKKADVANDNKAIDDLRDQLRHEGGDPGWLR
jgi:hypothetical protein